MFDFGQRNAFGQRVASNAGGQNPNGLSSAPNATGGKAIIKYNPSNNDTVAGIRAQATLFTWQSPTGEPQFVTVEVGRVANSYGGPDLQGSPGQPLVGTIGGQAGATFPARKDTDPNSATFLSPYYYRAYAQIILGTPGTMQDPFFIDIGRGQRFSACVSYVAVTAAMLGPPLDEATGLVIAPGGFGGRTFISGSLAVYGTLGVGITPTVAPVFYTQYIDRDLTGGGPFGAPYSRVIPPRANLLVDAQSSVAADTFQLAFNTPAIPGFTTPVFNNGQIGAFNGGGFPISDDATILLVTTTAAVANYKLIYQLSV